MPLYTPRVELMADYPRTYRASFAQCAFYFIIGGLGVTSGALGIWFFGTGRDPQTHGAGAVWLIGICLLFFLGGGYLIYAVLRARVTLTAGTIEVQSVSGTVSLRREELSAWRIVQLSKGPPILVLTPRDPLRRPIKVQQYFTMDNAFRAWLAPLTNPNEQERLAAERDITENVAFGFTTDERMAKLAAARRVAILLNVVTVIACVWGLFYPRPYSLVAVVLGILPWVAVVVAASSRGLIRIDQRRNDPHPFVAIPFIMPGFILALRAILDIHLIGWQTPLWVSIALGAALWYSAFRTDLSMQRSSVIALFLLLPSYGFGVFALSDALLDQSVPTRYAVHVIDKYVTSGRSTSYNLRLDPWGPETESTSIGVSRSFYDATMKGSNVCIYLRTGALHTPWYVVRHCPRNG